MTSATATVETSRATKLGVACAVVVFIVALVLYASTLAPTVTLVDSGELILAARTLGVAHPPGFPLYVMLAHLATLVPIGSIAVRVNFASALFAALASATAAVVASEAIAAARPSALSQKKAERGKKTKKAPERSSATEDTYSLAVACIATGLLLAFSRTLWAYATIAEVYTLNSMLILLIFLLMFRWRRTNIDTAISPRRSADGVLHRRLLYGAAFVFGVALGVHHVTVGLSLPAFAALVFATEGMRFFASRRLIYAALLAFAGLFAVYAYLPLAASRSPIMDWGDPRTFERLWWHVTGKQYQVFLSFSLRTMVSQFGDFMKLAAREFGPWWLPAAPALAITGLVAVYRREKAIFWFLMLVIAADLAYCLGYEIAEDKDAYYLPTFISMAIAAGFGAQWLLSIAKPARARVITVAVALLVPAAALVGNLPYNNRSHYYIARDYVDNILSTMEPGGMLLTRDWQVYSPMLYVREIERQRDDAVIIDINQLRRSWYYDYLNRAYPATIEQARDKVDAFLEDLRHWEHDPDLYQRDFTLNQRINSRFYEMIVAFVNNHIQSAPAYVTLDIAANRDGTDSELTKSLANSYQFVPQGLVFQLFEGRGFRQPSDSQLITRGLADDSIKFDDDDVVKLKVLPVYVMMFYNRGRYLAANGRHEQAIESFKRALDLDPRFAIARQAINESVAAIGKTSKSSAR